MIESKVALVVNFIPPYRVGVLSHLQAMVGHLVVLVSTAMEPDRNWEKDWKDLFVQLQRCITLKRRQRHPYGFTQVTYVHFPYRTISELRKVDPDLVISGEFGPRTILSSIYCWMSRKPLVIWATLSEHTEAGRGFIRKAVRRLLAHKADAIVVHGESAVRYLSSLGVDTKKILVAPQVVDPTKFAQYPLHREPKQALRLLYVGQMIELKGVRQLLLALSGWCRQHRSRHVELWMVGTGPLVQALACLPVPENLEISWFGEVPYADLPEIYARAGILVFPTLADEWGLVVNEALAAGLPVIGSVRSQAVEELILDGINGWVYDPLKEDSTASVLNRALLSKLDELREYRISARQSGLELTPQALASQLAAVSAQLTGSARSVATAPHVKPSLDR